MLKGFLPDEQVFMLTKVFDFPENQNEMLIRNLVTLRGWGLPLREIAGMQTLSSLGSETVTKSWDMF